MATKLSGNSPGALLVRLFRVDSEKLAPATAKYFLSLGFDEADKARMHELAVRNGEGGLSYDEHTELLDFIRADDLLTLLHSKARQALKKKKRPKAS